MLVSCSSFPIVMISSLDLCDKWHFPLRIKKKKKEIEHQVMSSTPAAKLSFTYCVFPNKIMNKNTEYVPHKMEDISFDKYFVLRPANNSQSLKVSKKNSICPILLAKSYKSIYSICPILVAYHGIRVILTLKNKLLSWNNLLLCWKFSLSTLEHEKKKTLFILPSSKWHDFSNKANKTGRKCTESRYGEKVEEA